jgi:hypothetical protein
MLFCIKLDHEISHVRHLNSPGTPGGFTVLVIVNYTMIRYNMFTFLISKFSFRRYKLEYKIHPKFLIHCVICRIQLFNMTDEKRNDVKVEIKD